MKKEELLNLKTIFLNRLSTSDQGTFGKLYDYDKLNKWILELPWNDNTFNISCIPYGSYVAIPYKYRGRINSFKLLNVPNRSNILIHGGNYAGDKSAGYKTHSAGCLIIGNKVGTIEKQKAVLSSRIGLREFIRYMNNKPFILTIKENIQITKSKIFY